MNRRAVDSRGSDARARSMVGGGTMRTTRAFPNCGPEVEKKVAGGRITWAAPCLS